MPELSVDLKSRLEEIKKILSRMPEANRQAIPLHKEKDAPLTQMLVHTHNYNQIGSCWSDW